MTGAAPTAVVGRPGELPDTLPGTLGEVGVADGGPPSQRVTLFLTVDTEDAYFERPIMMTGDGIGREYGVFGALDALDARGLKATFFVNVYESPRQPPRAVEGVVREIASRGHEVGLHSHPCPALEIYRRPLFRLSRPNQVEILRWGADLIGEWTGTAVTSFRAGGYALNDDTFAALEQVGIELDSSCFFPSPNNHFDRFTVNAVAARGPTIEVPVTTVLRADDGGALAQRKLDLDWLSTSQLDAALGNLAAHGGEFAMFMMHSFSFIEKRTLRIEQRPSPRARFVSQVLFDRYVEVCGPKPAMRDAFEAFLDRVVADPALRVRTLRDALPDLRRAAGRSPDVVPIVG